MKSTTISPLLFLIALTLFSAQKPALKYTTQSGEAYFYSSAPLEDIEAKSNKLVGVIAPSTRKMAFAVKITTFDFKNKLMQKHFNDDYMQSSTYPKATFVGVINEEVDLLKDTTAVVTLTGKLTIKGVEVERTLEGNLSIEGAVLKFNSQFSVPLADHEIKVPKMFVKNIAEEIDVTIQGVMDLK